MTVSHTFLPLAAIASVVALSAPCALAASPRVHPDPCHGSCYGVGGMLARRAVSQQVRIVHPDPCSTGCYDILGVARKRSAY